MIKNYLKVALRSIYKNKLFSLINVFGLSISISTCLLIISLIYGQTQFDDFHEKGNRIVRVLSSSNGGFIPYATAPWPLSIEVLENYSHLVEEAVRIKTSSVGGDVIYNQNRIPLAGRYVDDNFFSVFDFKLLSGSPGSALIYPFSIVLTKKSSEKLFGNENPIGKSVRIIDSGLNTLGIDLLTIGNKEVNLGDFVVTGVVEDDLPSHIQLDFLVSMATFSSLVEQEKIQVEGGDWINYNDSYLYLLLKDENKLEVLETSLKDISQKYYSLIDDLNVTFNLQSLLDITPGPIVNNPISITMPIEGVYFLSFLGLVVVLSACFNYLNLSFAKSLTRAKEIGVRKVVGAKRYQLFIQFVFESIIMIFISFIIAIIILMGLRAAFFSFWFNQFVIWNPNVDLRLYMIFFVFTLFVGVVAGIFPAMFLSSLSPIKTLKNFIGSSFSKGKKLSLQKFLLIIQFCVSLFFIITTISIYFQLNYLLNAEYGFDKQNIINIRLQGNNYEILSNEFSENLSIDKISASSFVPGSGISHQTVIKTPMSPERDIETFYIGVDQAFISNLKLKLIAGSNFPESMPKSSEQYVIVNEYFTQIMGYEQSKDIVGETILIGKEDTPIEVIGVIEDFFFELLIEIGKNEPLLLRYIPDEFNFMNIRYKPDTDLKNFIAYLEQKWNKVDYLHSFKYKVYEDELRITNSIFSDIVYILGFISFKAISISCLGLLGMAIYTSKSREKEICIRKVFGAKIKSIVGQLSKVYFWLFGISVLITVPIAYFFNNLWLDLFSYKVSFSAEIILLGVGTMFILSFATIFSQIVKVALNDIIKVLKNE